MRGFGKRDEIMRKEMVSLDYFMVQIQKKCDAVAGLKVQNIALKKENERLDKENELLSKQLTTLNHNHQKLKKEYEFFKEKGNVKRMGVISGDELNGGI